MSLADRIIKFYYDLDASMWKLPTGISLLNPFANAEARPYFEQFYYKYFSDHDQRHLIVGINPGRFGAGITGIPFTDPKILEAECEIINPFNKRYELSAIFIYEMIKEYGTIEAFYQKFLISSVVPLGFVKNGKNINYYDDKDLEKSLTPYIITYIRDQIEFGLATDKAFILGQGKNFKYFHKLNEKEQFFDEVIPLPHPRWVMQYRLKRKQEYLDEYMIKLGSV
jgi:hypothetical protein